jgi:hypothetical protein
LLIRVLFSGLRGACVETALRVAVPDGVARFESLAGTIRNATAPAADVGTLRMAANAVHQAP